MKIAQDILPELPTGTGECEAYVKEGQRRGEICPRINPKKLCTSLGKVVAKARHQHAPKCPPGKKGRKCRARRKD